MKTLANIQELLIQILMPKPNLIPIPVKTNTDRNQTLKSNLWEANVGPKICPLTENTLNRSNRLEAAPRGSFLFKSIQSQNAFPGFQCPKNPF